jgi:O-antigen ligase
VIAVAGFVLFSGAILPLLQLVAGTAPNVGEADRRTQALVAPFYLAAVLVLAWRPRRPSPVLVALRQPLIWYLVGWALLSTAWSDAPSITLRRAVALAGSTVFGLYVAARYSRAELMRLVGRAFLIILVLSVLFVVVGGYGVSSGIYAGAWRGVFADKNGLGRAMVLGAFTFGTLAMAAAGRRRLLYSLLTAAACLLVLLSRSATSLVVLAAMGSLTALCFGLQKRRSRFLSISLVGIVLSAGLLLWTMTTQEALLGALGKSTTLTGRTELWTASIAQFEAEPWLGYGFGAFWSGANSRGALVWEQIGWTPPHAHNGFIDLGLDLGTIGVVLFGLGYLLTVARALANVRPGAGALEVWPLLYLCYFVLANMTESALVRQNNVFWVLYCASSFALVRPRSAESSAPTGAEHDEASGNPAGTVPALRPGAVGQLSTGVRRRLRPVAGESGGSVGESYGGRGRSS